MTPPPARRRRVGQSGKPAQNLPRRGAIRRAQAITTYGVGSLIAVDQESFIVSGLDDADTSWHRDESPQIHERRLARLLGVSYFRLPPASDDDSKDGMRVRRFPQMHSCPECSDLQRYRDFAPPEGRSVCGICEVDLVPSRFVVACDAGHLGEFPYWHWVHRSTEKGAATAGQCGGKLKLRSSGRTSALRSIIISCDCGPKPEASLEGSFRKDALKDLGLSCRGTRPWLGTSAPVQVCGLPLRTLQRGSSAVWQPVLKSALSIPPWSDGRSDPLAEHWDALREYDNRRDIENYLKGAFQGKCPLPVDEVMAFLEAEREEDPDTGKDTLFERRYSALRNKEYERLHAGNEGSEHSRDEQFVCEPPTGDTGALEPLGVTGPMLVKRLREVRALKAFTRLADPDSAVDPQEMSLFADPARPLPWLPAMQVYGEGVFLRLDENRLRAWEELAAARVGRMRMAHQRVLAERAGDRRQAAESPATPRMVLLHTLAHILINEWSLDAGYPAAALRERLYAGDDMAGVLIYTATSDSAGSLGGLVAQGEPEHLESTIRSAVRRAEWCSSDPLCMETGLSGGIGTNLAACHACVMLPETSCEHNNILLDRALLVGTPEDPDLGFFANVLAR